MKRVFLVGLSLLLVGLTVADATALVFTDDRGNWPEEWPEQLELLREPSRTVCVATLLQQNIYEIPIPDRVTFDRIWPAVLKVRTPGSPLTLYRAGSAPPKAWGDLLSNKRSAIRIYGPAGNYLYLGKSDPKQEPPWEEWIREGRAVRLQPPWPEYLPGEQGELPEWVLRTEGDDGRIKLVPADPNDEKSGGHRGFYHRIRIDVELVVDGDVIDLNRVAFPEGVTVFDRRFDREK